MTSKPDLAQLAARVLAQESPGARSTPAEDEQAIRVVAQAIRARRLRERRARWLALSAAAATIALSLGVAYHLEAARTTASSPTLLAPGQPASPSMSSVVASVVGEAYVLHGGQSFAVAAGGTVSAGDELVVQHGAGVTLDLPTGTHVIAEEGADVTVVAQGATQLFGLKAGSLRAEVHKLAQGERFLVRTADAEIEVRGTSFRVATVAPDASCGEGTTTRLTVYKGIVAVRAGKTETSVRAGEEWPTGCGTATESAHASAVSPRSSNNTAPPVVGGAASVLGAPARSQLAEQNDLYSGALAARDAGDSIRAIALFDSLVTKYPKAPLAENALAEMMKLLATSNPARAAQVARDYLVRYPGGYARTDATRILAKQTGGL